MIGARSYIRNKKRIFKKPRYRKPLGVERKPAHKASQHREHTGDNQRRGEKKKDKLHAQSMADKKINKINNILVETITIIIKITK